MMEMIIKEMAAALRRAADRLDRSGDAPDAILSEELGPIMQRIFDEAPMSSNDALKIAKRDACEALETAAGHDSKAKA